jgi:hypothetical protein
MRGIAAVRADEQYQAVFGDVDRLLDNVPRHSPHLLLPEANLLHYLRAIRFARTDSRGRFVSQTYDNTPSTTVKRGCVECWRLWHDRPHFIALRNRWQGLGAEEQRMLWLAASEFSEEGVHARKQLRTSALQSWRLGLENEKLDVFPLCYMRWCENAQLS